MLMGVPRHIILNTIAKNYLRVGIIRESELDYAKEVLSQLNEEELIKSLMESHMLNPINLEQHQLGAISEN